MLDFTTYPTTVVRPATSSKPVVHTHRNDPFPLALWARRWAPWQGAAAVLLALAILHAFWAMGFTWPAQTRAGLADAVYGYPPFLTSSGAWWWAASLFVAFAAVVASMSPRVPLAVRRPCCGIAMMVVAILMLRGFVGELTSLPGIEATTTEFRILDIFVYSPICFWTALGIVYR